MEGDSIVTPADWRAMIDAEIPSSPLHTPTKYQGQIVRRSYAQHEGYIFERIDDSSDGSLVVKVYRSTEWDFEPWNNPPVLGELMWTETLS